MPKPIDLPSELKDVDAYLQWLYSTGYRYYDPERKGTIVLLARFLSPIENVDRTRLRAVGLQVSPWYEGYRHATVTASLANLPKQLAFLANEGACVELASPTAALICPGLPTVQPPANDGPDTVLGIIDDGCPFAHRHFRPTDPQSLAVRFIWNQGAACGSGNPGMWVPYGAPLPESDLKNFLALATTAGHIDEDKAYSLSGLPGLRHATSHGAQVMSHASGHARQNRNPFTPNFRSDIAFVQLEPDALDDPSGQWMNHYALDGILAICFYALAMFKSPAKRVIINLSYGPQTGPHDGTSIFETAIDELTSLAAVRHCDLQVVVPSGNSHRLRTHAEFDLANNGGVIDWCVMPDTQVSSYLEIWLPPGASMKDLQVTLTCPTGEQIPALDSRPMASDDGTATVHAGPVCGHPLQTVIKMIIGPTAAWSESTAPAVPLAVPGRWKVQVSVLNNHQVTVPNPVAHAYLARIDPNMGRKRRGHSGYLDSPLYDPSRYLRASPQLLENKPPGPAEVAAWGSMSGIATGLKINVASGYVAATGMPSLYSSGGPTRGPRTGPDWAYPTDDSAALSGRLADGNRSGTVMRLTGTSFAAPQLARELLEGPLPGVLPPPQPPWFQRRFGKGMR